MGPEVPRVTVFGPNPVLTVTVERRTSGGDDIHLHAGGQGVWVARAAAELGAHPVLCALVGGEAGGVIRGLLESMPGDRRLVETAAPTLCTVADRRGGRRELIASSWSGEPSRHELDDLFSSTCAAALDSDVLVVCNPWPGDTLPLEVYGNLVCDVRANGTPVLVDLSSRRLDSALEGAPDLVKLNDWELAEYVAAPVEPGERLRAAAERLLDAGAQAVVVTRGEKPGFAVHGQRAWEVVPPRLERGFREGCGDAMMGAMAAVWSSAGFEEALRLGAGAGAANFLRHGLGRAKRPVIEELSRKVELRPI